MAEYMQMAQSVMEEVKKAVIGKDECVKKVMAAILAGGHILIEDIPGVGNSGSRKDNTCPLVCKMYGNEAEPCAVYTGCTSGGYYRIFHV